MHEREALMGQWSSTEHKCLHQHAAYDRPGAHERASDPGRWVRPCARALASVRAYPSLACLPLACPWVTCTESAVILQLLAPPPSACPRSCTTELVRATMHMHAAGWSGRVCPMRWATRNETSHRLDGSALAMETGDPHRKKRFSLFSPRSPPRTRSIASGRVLC